MIKFQREVSRQDLKLGTMEVVYDSDDVTITYTSELTAEVSEMHIPHEAAAVLYELISGAQISGKPRS